MKTVEEFFSQFVEEGKVWRDGLLVKTRNNSLDKVFAVLPMGAVKPESIPYFVVGSANVDSGLTTWNLNGAFSDDGEFGSHWDIVEIYSGELLAKTEEVLDDKDTSDNQDHGDVLQGNQVVCPQCGIAQ